MPARVAIRRLELQGLAPRDHPASSELGRRLRDAAQALLPEALAEALGFWSGDAVLRIRRLEVDVTLDAAFDPRVFTAALAKSIARELRAASERGPSDGVLSYPSRALYLAALLEALAEGRALDRWWLRDAEGLRFLTAAQAIRTAISADARTGLEALASLPLLRRMAVLRGLTPVEAERILGEFARVGGGASLTECAEAVRRAAAKLPDDAPALAVYVETFSQTPALAGKALAVVARLWAELNASGRNGPESATAGLPEEEAARRILAGARNSPSESAAPLPIHSVRRPPHAPAGPPSFGHCNRNFRLAGRARRRPHAHRLCRARPLRWPGPFRGISRRRVMARAVRPRPSRACVLRRRSPPRLRRRRLVGARAVRRAAAASQDARFLLLPQRLVTQRQARRVLAGLARVVTKRFARRLPGFHDASAPFLWANVLGTSAALERRPGGWSARVSRAPLDVVLSLARAAEGSVQAPSGLRIDIARTSA